MRFVVTDQQFLNAFFSRTLPNQQFHHRDHLRLTWLVLREHGREAGSQRLKDGIRQFAAAQGHAARYHETMTQFWIWLVDHARRARPQVDSFEGFLSEFPIALDKSLPFRHWSHDALMSPTARSDWLEPDVLPLP